jgi:hypothetical protein
MPLLASLHAAFETVSQIGFADFEEGCDDLLLSSVGQLYLMLSGHDALSASYYSINCAKP